MLGFPLRYPKSFLMSTLFNSLISVFLYRFSLFLHLGHAFVSPVDVYAVSPSLFTYRFFSFSLFKINYRTALHKFLKVNERIPSSEDYTLSEALYTFEGSSSMVLGTVSALRI